MKVFLLLAFLAVESLLAQNHPPRTTKDTLITVNKSPAKGFFSDYVLYIPQGVSLAKKTYLLIEPNNTGRVSDSLQVHHDAAIHLASVSSVGNNVSRMAGVPLLVPVFPRPASQELLYTHALDRDVMLMQADLYKRLDLQLLAMAEDAKTVLESMNIQTEQKFLMCGFSASATFVNRFSFLHPKKIKALAIGGFNGELILPQSKIGDVVLDYPIGTNDFELLFGKTFDFESFAKIPQYIYMGALDDNDAVQFADAYDDHERKIINENINRDVQKRYSQCQDFYRTKETNITFMTYPDVGHWTTSQMNLDIIAFFVSHLD